MEITIFQNSATALLESFTFLLLDGIKSSLSSSSGDEPSSRCRVGMLASLYSRRIPLSVSSVTGRSPLVSIHCSIWEREKGRERRHVREETFAENGST
jgi:hypothetical protein